MFKHLTIMLVMTFTAIVTASAAYTAERTEEVVKMRRELIEMLNQNESDLLALSKKSSTPPCLASQPDLEETAADVIELSQTQKFNISNDTLDKSQQIIDIVSSMQDLDIEAIIRGLKQHLASKQTPAPATDTADAAKP